MTPLYASAIAVMTAAEAEKQRRLSERAQEKIEVSREECAQKAAAVPAPLLADRDRRVCALIEATRAKRVALNRWLPRPVKFSLEEAVIRKVIADDISQLWRTTSAYTTACARLAESCLIADAPTVVVRRQDWALLERAFAWCQASQAQA